MNNDVVKVRLLGNCIGCTVNQMTLKNGVEMTIKKHVGDKHIKTLKGVGYKFKP